MVAAPYAPSCCEAYFKSLTHSPYLLYLDDLLLFSKGVDENVEKLEVVFKLLQRYGLKLKPSKCHILQSQVKYLGFVVSKGGISTDPEKIRAVRKWPIPCTVKELRAFVAFCSSYRRFFEGFGIL